MHKATKLLPGATLRTFADPRDLVAASTAAAREGFEVVVAAGGDGTVSAVAGGLIEAGTGTRLGILPIGTGNDFARGLGLGRVASATKALLAGRTRRVDAIRSTRPGEPGVWALNAAVAGLGGRVSEDLSRSMRRRWGRLSYLRVGLAEFARARPRAVSLRVDDRRFELEALMVVIANGRFAGGGLPFAPTADPSDGRLEVVVLLETPGIMVAPTLLRLLRGAHAGADNVLSVEGASIGIEAGDDVCINLDGETWGSGAAEFSVAPAALDVLVPWRSAAGNGAPGAGVEVTRPWGARLAPRV